MTVPFTAWRLEIIAALDQARARLAAGQAALFDAELTAADSKRELRMLNAATEKLGPRISLASALFNRIHAHRTMLQAADGEVVRARHEIAAAHSLISDLQEAVTQIDRMAPAAERETIESESETT